MNKDHYRKRVTEPVQQMSVIAPEKPSARDWFPEERVTRLENQGNEPPGEVATGDFLRHRVDAEVGPLGSKPPAPAGKLPLSSGERHGLW